MAYDSEQARKAGKKSSRKGIPNKLSSETKEAMLSIIEAQVKEFPDLLKRMSPSDRAKYTLQLMEFVEGKKSRVEAQHEHTVKQIKVKAPKRPAEISGDKRTIALPSEGGQGEQGD